MDKIRPLSNYGINASNCYFAPDVVKVLKYAQTPDCRHIEKEKNDNGITGCQLLVAMAEANKNLLKFLGIKEDDKSPTNILRKRLGIVPAPLKSKEETTVPKADNEPVSYKQMDDICPDRFTLQVLHGAGQMGNYPRIAYEPEILSSFGAHVYATVPMKDCSIEVNDLLVECFLATARQFTERARQNKIILPVIPMTSFVFPYDIGETYHEGIPVFADLKCSYLADSSSNGKK